MRLAVLHAKAWVSSPPSDIAMNLTNEDGVCKRHVLPAFELNKKACHRASYALKKQKKGPSFLDPSPID